ncbi:MAG: hypothetical protein GY749_22465 [Desulfobacteraceae bacterium]|nr:hypothetical protein [Desulfobacteraceae bacterium]
MQPDELQKKYKYFLTPILGLACSKTHSGKEILNMAKRCIETRSKVSNDLKALEKGARAKLINPEVLDQFRSKDQGVAIVAFHLGPYSNIPCELGYMGYNVDMLVSEDVAQNQGEFYQKIAEPFNGKLKIFTVGKISELKNVLRRLKQGNLLLFYIDGNDGFKYLDETHKSVAEFNLLSMPVKIRTGVPRLTRMARVPIVMALSYYNQAGEKTIEFLDPIEPPDKDGHIQWTIRIYKQFENFLRKYPEQWEGWLYPFRFWPDMNPPTVDAEQLTQQYNQVQNLVENNNHNLRIQADLFDVGIIENCVFDVAGRSFLHATPTACDIIRSALEGADMQQLFKNHTRDSLVMEITRLSLAGLIRVET